MSKKVVFCIPTVTRPYQQCLDSLEASISLIHEAGIDEGMVTEVGNPYISGARAKMLRKALDAGATDIVFIDHDLSWRPSDLLKLVQTEGDVVAGTYRFKSDDVSYMGTIYTNHDGIPTTRADGCIKAKLVPAGFLKVTAGAVDKFMTRFPALCYGEKYHLSVDLFNHGARDGLWWGEDYAFSRNWESIGGELWLIPDLELHHHSKDKSFPGNFHNFLRSQPGGDLHE